MKATIYKIYPPTPTRKYRYTLTEPENDIVYSKHVYDLPDDYTIGQNENGQPMIFDPNGDRCVLEGNKEDKYFDLLSRKYWIAIYEN